MKNKQQIFFQGVLEHSYILPKMKKPQQNRKQPPVSPSWLLSLFTTNKKYFIKITNFNLRVMNLTTVYQTWCLPGHHQCWCFQIIDYCVVSTALYRLWYWPFIYTHKFFLGFCKSCCFIIRWQTIKIAHVICHFSYNIKGQTPILPQTYNFFLKNLKI